MIHFIESFPSHEPNACLGVDEQDVEDIELVFRFVTGMKHRQTHDLD